MNKIKKILTGNEIVIIPQTKGGVGKTTTATQVVAPFLFMNNGGKKVRYIEVDDLNKGSDIFTDSEVFSSEKIAVDDKFSISDVMTSSEVENQNIILDLGGSLTTKTVIKGIGYNEDFDNVFWIIPLGDGKEDAQNAVDTYAQIREIYKKSVSGSRTPKTMFVLSKAVSSDERQLGKQFWHFFGSDWHDVDFVVKDEAPDVPFIVMQNAPLLILSKIVRRPFVEMATNEYIVSVKKKKEESLQRAHALGKDEKASEADILAAQKEKRKYSEIFGSTKEIREYCEYYIEPLYKELSNFLLKK